MKRADLDSGALALFGGEYIPAVLMREVMASSKEHLYMLWSEVPDCLRASEEMVRNSNGISDPTWTKHHLVWRGCGRAVPFRHPYWLPCGYEATGSGFCKRHERKAKRLGQAVDNPREAGVPA